MTASTLSVDRRQRAVSVVKKKCNHTEKENEKARRVAENAFSALRFLCLINLRLNTYV